MAVQTDITPIFAIPPRTPELHWDLIGRLRAELKPLQGRRSPVWVHPADPNLYAELQTLPEKAYKVWKATEEEERFALSGYAGAPLWALTDEEIKRELQWAERNPWGGGAKLYELDRSGPFRGPFLVDPERAPLWEGKTSLLATFHRERIDRLLYSRGPDLYSLPLLRLTRAALESRGFARTLGSFLHQCRKEELPGLLLMEVDSAPGAVTLLREAVSAVCESRALSKRLNLASFPLEAGTPESAQLLSFALRKRPIAGTPFAPTLHRGMRQAAAQRSLPGSSRERQRMVLTAFREEQPGEARNPAYGVQRVYTAAMHGSAEIVGDSFSVQTEEGRPAHFATPEGGLGLGEAAETTLRFPSSLAQVPRELCSVESVTAFSFEGPLSRGIREESALRGAISGHSRLDSFFLSDYEELFLALELSIRGSIEEDLLLTPVELALSRLKKEATPSVMIRRTIPRERTLRDAFCLERGEAIPIFASEVSIRSGDTDPDLRCGSAELWKRTVIPMAMATVPGAGRRGGTKLVFAPFGMIQLPKGEFRQLTLRRTVRIAPAGGEAPFPRLSRDLQEELLLWEGKEL